MGISMLVVHILPNLGGCKFSYVLQDCSSGVCLNIFNTPQFAYVLNNIFLAKHSSSLTYLNIKSCLLGYSLSASCVPLYNFNYTYDYIMSASTSFVDRYKHLTFALGFLALVMNEFWRRISCYICE